MFRRRLVHVEGFDLGEMIGFGGDRPWTEVSTELEPFLNHPDDHSKDLSPQDCARRCSPQAGGDPLAVGAETSMQAWRDTSRTPSGFQPCFVCASTRTVIFASDDGSDAVVAQAASSRSRSMAAGLCLTP
ncbi:hypothetical protein ACIRU3_43670 [Streptomyces sp. NPDC101151]|uniref:hypothetical protein n=1 Tax=Streptomyces sp. NPDC101151 TaxID=3366115 RepID=UPI0037F6A237